MPKRAAPGTPSKPRKRGRTKKDAEGGGGEDDAELQHQLKRAAIINQEEEEEWVREMEQEEGGYLLDDIYIPPKITRTEHPFTGERLVVEKIVCEHFKSYGGVKEMGPFHKSFSAIIGPNGNGKSNIIDAMLFVFGYRASKIRCKKVSTLIHNSELLPNLKRCAVTVHFVKIIDDGDKEKEGADDFQIVEGSQIAVKRVARSDNSSLYYLNNKQVKFQEIAKFLKSNGVDLTHNRFLILQGEVEQIAQMPPIGANGNDGLLEFLEDVIGTRRYIRPLALLDDRIEKLDYARDEKLQRVDKAEKDKLAMHEPVKKAKEYMRDQNSKTKYLNMLYQKQTFGYQQHLVEKEKVKHELDVKITTIQARLNEINSLNEERKEELKQAEKAFRVKEKEHGKLKKKFDASDAEFIQLNQDLARTNETRKKQLKEQSKLENEIEKLIAVPESHQKELEVLTKRKLELEVDIQKEEDRIKDDVKRLELKIAEAVKQKEVSDRQFAAAKSKLDAKKSHLEKLKKQLANQQEREATEAQRLEQQIEELDKLKESIAKKEREGRTSLGGNRMQAIEAKIQTLTQQETQLQQVEKNKQANFENAREEFNIAQDSTRDSGNMAVVDRTLLEAKADGTIPGLYGRLKNLATIEEKYNVAATQATGMLEYWVCDNEHTATDAIALLREKQLPSQTFVCLTKLQRYQRSVNQSFSTPRESQRIFDLLKISDRVLAPAFYKAFTDTLVCDNLDVATKVAFGGTRRYRVVTLKGEIVQPQGTMVGGGRPLQQGLFNSKKSGVTYTKQQIANLRKKHDDALVEYQKAQEARQVVTEELRKLSEELADMKRKLNNFTSDLAALKTQLPLKEANVENQKKKVKECALSPPALKAKEDEIEKASQEHEEELEPFQDAEASAKKMGEKLDELQVTKMHELQKKLEKFKDQLKKVTAEHGRLTVELKNCTTNHAKAEKKLETVKREIETLEKTMKDKGARREQLKEEAAEIRVQEQELAAEVEVLKKTFEEKKGASNEFQKEENALTKEKAGLENKRSDAAGELRGLQQQIKACENSLENLKLHDIVEEEVEPLQRLTDEQIRTLSLPELERKVKKYDDKIKSRAAPNLAVLDAYKKKIEELMERLKELEEITNTRDKFRETYCKLDQQRSTEFMEGFALISSRLKEMFRMISMGGDAELEVVDTLDLFGCGINFSVRPARKTWKKISNLSGGEKTLASLSLVFALHHFKPSPFYVMDEIDAALDFKNVSIIANYIKDRTKFTQFIIISLRSNMFELADSLLGVYKVDNMSYCIHFGVKKIVTELRRRAGRKPSGAGGTQTAATQGSSANTQGSNQNQDNGDLNEPVPGPSRAVRAQEKIPGIDVSEIQEDEDGEAPGSPTIVEKTIVEGDEDVACTPPSRITKAPNNAVQRKSVGGGDAADEDSATAPKRPSLPLYTSTPFVGRRPQGDPEREQAPGQEESKGGVEDMELSPIKADRPGPVPNRSESPTSSDASFKTAEDSIGDEDILGPSQ